MSCQQNQQRCKFPVKCLPRCSPKWPLQAPQAPQTPQASQGPQASAPCPAPCPAACPPPAPSCCVPSCCITGFRSCCSLGYHGLPGVCLGQPQPSSWERESSGCSSYCHGFGGCSWPAGFEEPKIHGQGQVWSWQLFSLSPCSPFSSWTKLPRYVLKGLLFLLRTSDFVALALGLHQGDLNATENSAFQNLVNMKK